MVFSSPVFLYLFLPLLLGLHALLPRRTCGPRNLLLLAASLLFYAWGELHYVPLLLACIVFNWLCGLALARATSRRARRLLLAGAVLANLGALAVYKYADFFAAGINSLLHLGPGPGPGLAVPIPALALPLGISFFTFHAISYMVDVYRRDAVALASPFDMGLYIALFPQLVAGPIVRFHEIAAQLSARTQSLARFASGVERFCYGLAKKVLIANTLGEVADAVFALPPLTLSAGTAWLGLLCYTLQIYFDFSGYSDMAIGLGRMFGFELPENFNYPYTARSVREYWRRWHLSLSAWFRDYVYIPLGGNRRGAWRTARNLVIVFLLCGLWHGAAWTFVLWGAWHGVLLLLERGAFGAWLDRLPRPLATAYTLLMVMLGLLLFRAPDLLHARQYFAALRGRGDPYGDTGNLDLLLNPHTYAVIGVALLLCTPLFCFLSRDCATRRFPAHAVAHLPAALAGFNPPGMPWLRGALSLTLLLLAMATVAAGTYNPFIYFRF